MSCVHIHRRHPIGNTPSPSYVYLAAASTIEMPLQNCARYMAVHCYVMTVLWEPAQSPTNHTIHHEIYCVRHSTCSRFSRRQLCLQSSSTPRDKTKVRQALLQQQKRQQLPASVDASREGSDGLHGIHHRRRLLLPWRVVSRWPNVG